MNESEVVQTHQPCDDCGSSDGLALYDDGHTFCFVCNTRTRGDGRVTKRETKVSNTDLQYQGIHDTIPDRKIKAETCRKYGVKIDPDTGTHYYPYYNNQGDHVIGTKVRKKGKEFRTSGDMKNNTLFGQQLFKGGGKYLTVVEGELDALAAYEILGSKWPVVSVSKGAAGAVKDIQANLEWLESFENIVFIFDNDSAGVEAVQKCAPILSPNKAKVVRLEKHKDASDYLRVGNAKDFVSEWWEAKPYVITGVASVDDMRAALLDYQKTELIPLPESFGDLQEKTRGGLARGELTSIIAHTSIGKTSILNELIYHFATNTNEKIGCFMVEDNIDETVRKVVSVHDEMNLQLLRPEELDVDHVMKSALDIGFGSKVQLYNDGGGSIDIDDMFSKIRYFIKGLGCTVILVDPLHTAIKNLSNENVEEVMDRFIKLCKETKACVILSTHTRKPDDGASPHKISEYDVKGSGAIPQACHNNILFSRDKLALDEYEKNSLRIRVPKLRRTGQTGEAGWAYYNSVTGRLEKGQSPERHSAGQESEF